MGLAGSGGAIWLNEVAIVGSSANDRRGRSRIVSWVIGARAAVGVVGGTSDASFSDGVQPVGTVTYTHIVGEDQVVDAGGARVAGSASFTDQHAGETGRGREVETLVAAGAGGAVGASRAVSGTGHAGRRVAADENLVAAADTLIGVPGLPRESGVATVAANIPKPPP